MQIPSRVLMLGVAGMLAITAASSLTGQALARPKSPAQRDCEARGFVWDTYRNACADKDCPDAGYGSGHPGDQVYVTTPSGHIDIFYCDGVTGDWVVKRPAPTVWPADPVQVGASAPPANAGPTPDTPPAPETSPVYQ